MLNKPSIRAFVALCAVLFQLNLAPIAAQTSSSSSVKGQPAPKAQSSPKTPPELPSGLQASLPPGVPNDAAQYVRQIVQHQVTGDEQDHALFRFRFHRESERLIYDRDVIETKDGQLARTLLIDGKPLTAEQRANDEARLQRLMTDPDDRAKHNKRLQDDILRARKMLRSIPDAFIFKHDGTENGMVRISFTPNPRYDPPSRELQVFHSMKGTMWIHPAGQHLTRIDGQLIEDVSFGWGILGKLRKGGTFKVEQREVAPGHWQITSLDVNMTGYAIIFKNVNVKQHQIQGDFRRMPDGITMAQAYDLFKQDAAAAAKSSEAKTAEAKPGAAGQAK